MNSHKNTTSKKPNCQTLHNRDTTFDLSNWHETFLIPTSYYSIESIRLNSELKLNENTTRMNRIILQMQIVLPGKSRVTKSYQRLF